MTNNKNILDSWLVLESQLGNKKAMTVLVKRWHPKLCKQAYWYVKDEALAKDIAQDCWNIILRKLKQLKDSNRFGSWALQIVRRKSLDILRKQQRRKSAFPLRNEGAEPIEDSKEPTQIEESIGLMKQAILSLPYQQQEVLNLFYMEECSIREVSEILDISKGTVKSRLYTAREKLKTILKNRYHEK